MFISPLSAVVQQLKFYPQQITAILELFELHYVRTNIQLLLEVGKR